MKKKILILFSMIVCLMFVGNVKAEVTFSELMNKFKTEVESDAIIKDTIKSITVNEDNVIINYSTDFYGIAKETYTGDITFNYADNKITYSYTYSDDKLGELYLNKDLIEILISVIGIENNFSNEEVSYANSHLEFLDEESGITAEVLSKDYNYDIDGGTATLTIDGIKSLTIDLSKLNLEIKPHVPVSISLEQIVEKLKEDTISDKITEIKNDDKSITFKISDTVNYDKKNPNQKVEYDIVINYNDNKLTYNFEDDDSMRAYSELKQNSFIIEKLFKIIANFNNYNDYEFRNAYGYKEYLTMEKNGVLIKTMDKDNVFGTNVDDYVAVYVSGISELNIDLTKFSLENMDIPDEEKPVITGEKCSEKDGKYYDKNGNSVSKEAYFESCGVVENPKTGLMIPVIILGLFGIMGISLIIKRKNYFESI